MKRIFFALIIASALLFTSSSANGQAWERNTKVLSLGFGASQFFHIDDYTYSYGLRHRTWYWPVTGQINFQGEFGIHKYVGLGFTTGFGGRGSAGYGYSGVVNFPIGMIMGNLYFLTAVYFNSLFFPFKIIINPFTFLNAVLKMSFG